MENYRKLSVPPHLSASRLVQYIKANTWEQNLWARGHLVASSGNVIDKIIREYIKNQDLKESSK